MVISPVSSLVVATSAMLALSAGFGADLARADHKCDPLSEADVGWSVVPSHETISQVDQAPYQAGAGGNWYVDRATTVLPFCNYYNAIGNYSMRSYSLSERVMTERIAICRGNAQGVSTPVEPYAGSCPPR